MSDNIYGKVDNISGNDELKELINSIDINNLTPLQAINRLQEIKTFIESEAADD